MYFVYLTQASYRALFPILSDSFQFLLRMLRSFPTFRFGFSCLFFFGFVFVSTKIKMFFISVIRMLTENDKMGKFVCFIAMYLNGDETYQTEKGSISCLNNFHPLVFEFPRFELGQFVCLATPISGVDFFNLHTLIRIGVICIIEQRNLACN